MGQVTNITAIVQLSSEDPRRKAAHDLPGPAQWYRDASDFYTVLIYTPRCTLVSHVKNTDFSLHNKSTGDSE